MRQFALILLVPLLVVPGTNPLLSQQVETAQPARRLPLLSTCETTEPSPRTQWIELPPDLEVAERELRARLVADPSDVTVQSDLGMLFEIRRDFSAALISYQEALKLDRSCSDCVVSLSSLLHHCKQNVDSVRVVEDFLEANPRSAPAVTHLAFLHLELQQYDEGLRLARRHQKLEEESAVGYHLQAMAHLGLKQRDEAEAYFKIAVEHDDSLAEAHLQLGLLYGKQPETFDAAAVHLRKAIDLGLVHPEIYKDLGRVLVSREQYLDAIEELQKALTLNPDYAEPYYFLSKSYEKLGQQPQAEAAMERFRALDAAQVAPSETRAQARAHYLNGMQLLQQRNATDAYPAFLRAIEIDDAFDSPYFRLAQLNSMSDRPQQAVELVRKAIALNPIRPEYYLLLGESLPKTEAEAAIEAILEGIKLNPRVATPYNSLGNIQFADGRYEPALRSYRQAIKLDDENPIFHLNLSSVLRQTGDEEGSKRERDLYMRLSAEQNN